MKHFLIYIFIIIATIAYSQSKDSIVVYDNEKIIIKKFNENKIDSYKKQNDFIYTEKKREVTWLEKTVNWLKRVVKNILSYLFDDITPAVGFLRFVLKILPYIIGLIVLYLIIKFFLNVNAKNIISGKKNDTIVTLTEEEELIKKKNLKALITEAVANKNYQLAIRYYYLLVLKKLADEEQIIWQPEKTNTDYSYELRTSSISKSFNEITYLYDYVWYGDFNITELEFTKAESKFKSLIDNNK